MVALERCYFNRRLVRSEQGLHASPNHECLIDAMGVFWRVESSRQIRKIVLKGVRTQKGFSRTQNVGDQGGSIVLIHSDDSSACQLESRSPRPPGCRGY